MNFFDDVDFEFAVVECFCVLDGGDADGGERFVFGDDFPLDVPDDVDDGDAVLWL